MGTIDGMRIISLPVQLAFAIAVMFARESRGFALFPSFPACWFEKNSERVASRVNILYTVADSY